MTGDNNGLDRQYSRWRDYANVLLIGLTVLFAGPAISQTSTYSVVSVIFGVIGILAVVSWHALEYNWQYKQKPVFLLAASVGISVQAIMLIFHLVTT
jgi:hypothetical protein